MSETSSGGLYSILGAKPDASYKELKACYQKAILQCHPDKLPRSVSEEDRSAAKQQFSKVDMAWRTLCNDASRKAYDVTQTEQKLRKPFPVNEQVFLEDMEWQEDDEVYTHACRCGGEYIANDNDVEQNYLIISCNTCTLSIQLVINDSETNVTGETQVT
ncbi:dnaJ homolog subfamily C member 24-like [Asterias amurensis]|uniref:dnaJ homolog subfamily C member 24-like n=1 Tax=Asterias amurensis TaxID=7602 RepID=UPI003AB1E24A